MIIRLILRGPPCEESICALIFGSHNTIIPDPRSKHPYVPRRDETKGRALPVVYPANRACANANTTASRDVATTPLQSFRNATTSADIHDGIQSAII